MLFASKTYNRPENGFWVEDYTDDERDFFISLGFEEKFIQVFDGFEGTLYFNGSDIFGLWTEDEYQRITEQIKEHFNIDGFYVYEPKFD